MSLILRRYHLLLALCQINISKSYLPTSLLGQDMTQGQFLSGV